MNKFGVALKILIDELGIRKSRLEEEGKLRRTGLNQSMHAKRAPRADKIDDYLKAFGVTWMEYARVLMQVEDHWDRIQVQPAQRQKVTIDGAEINLQSLDKEDAGAKRQRNKAGPSGKATAHKKYA